MPLKLKNALAKRAVEFGTDPSAFDAAIAKVSQVVSLCLQVSSSEFAASIDLRSPQRMPLSRLQGGKYKSCASEFAMLISKSGTLLEKPAEVSDGDWRKQLDGTNPAILWVRPNYRMHWSDEQKNWNGPKFHLDADLVPWERRLVKKEDRILSLDIKASQ